MTLSKLPSEPPKATNPEPEARQFLALNRQVYRELLTFIDFAADFTVGFVEVNFSPNVEILIQALQADSSCQEIQFEVMDFSQQPDLRFLRDEIVQRLPTLERHPDQKLVLLVLGLKEAIGVNLQGDYPPVLQDLNFVRDAYKRSVPHPILFFLPDYAITRLAKFAPDFWAWRSGVFLFQTPQVTKDYARAEALESDRRIGSSGLPESPERIALLESLLMDCRHSPGRAITTADLSTCNTLLHQLGVAYLSRREAAKAQNYLQEALTLAQQRDDVPLTAEITQVLGRTLAEQRQFEAAERAYQNALAQFRQLGNQRAEANTLFYLGNVELDLRNFAQAETYYQQCLTIEQALGDDYSTASTYHQLGMVVQAQRRFENAIAFYQKALDLEESVGDTYGIAGSYHQLGTVAQYQHRFEDAIAFYQKALKICEEIGSEYDSARVLHQLGMVAQAQRRFENAISFYQKALTIYEAAGDDYQASDEYQGLGTTAKEQGDLATAIGHFQTAFAATQSANDWRRASVSLTSWAEALGAQGNNLEATQLYFQALAIDQQHNPDFVDTDIEDLGHMLNQLGEPQFLTLWPADLSPESSNDLRAAIWQAAQALTET